MLVQLCTATHVPLPQFKSKSYTLTEHFNQGKSQGNVLFPPPCPYLDCCVCKQRALKSLICWTLPVCGPLSPFSAQTHWAQEPSWHLPLHFLIRLKVAWAFLLITYTDLRSKLDHIPLSCFLPNGSYFINTLVSTSEDFTGQNTLTHQSKTLQAAHK